MAFNACSLFSFTVSPQKFKLSSNRFQARLVLTTGLFTWNCLSMLVYQIDVLKIFLNTRSSVLPWDILRVTLIFSCNTRTIEITEAITIRAQRMMGRLGVISSNTIKNQRVGT